MHRRRRKHRHLLRRPAIEAQNGGLTGNNSALRHRERGQDSGAARHRDQFAVRVHARDAANVRIDRARFLHVHGRSHRADLDQPEDGIGVDQSGVNMFARPIDDFRARWNGRVRSDGGDLSVVENDGAGRNVRAADRMNRRAFDRDRFRLRRRRNRVRCVYRCRHRDSSGKGKRPKKGAAHSDASSMQVCLSWPLP